MTDYVVGSFSKISLSFRYPYHKMTQIFFNKNTHFLPFTSHNEKRSGSLGSFVIIKLPLPKDGNKHF
jgi:hypothetical protein